MLKTCSKLGQKHGNKFCAHRDVPSRFISHAADLSLNSWYRYILGSCGSGVEPASYYLKVGGLIPLACMSKCPWIRHWTPNCSWCAARQCMNVCVYCGKPLWTKVECERKCVFLNWSQILIQYCKIELIPAKSSYIRQRQEARYHRLSLHNHTPLVSKETCYTFSFVPFPQCFI